MYQCKHYPVPGSEWPCEECSPNAWAKLRPKEQAAIRLARGEVVKVEVKRQRESGPSAVAAAPAKSSSRPKRGTRGQSVKVQPDHGDL